MAVFGIQFAERHLSKNKSNSFGYKTLIESYIFRNRAEYITVLSVITFIAYVIFHSIHFDYDQNVDRLWKKVGLPKKFN